MTRHCTICGEECEHGEFLYTCRSPVKSYACPDCAGEIREKYRRSVFWAVLVLAVVFGILGVTAWVGHLQDQAREEQDQPVPVWERQDRPFGPEIIEHPPG